MSIESFMQLYVSNINSVVLWLALIVLALIAFYLLMSLRQEKLQLDGGGHQFGQLEETLKKVLETANLGQAAVRETSQQLVGDAAAAPGAHAEVAPADAGEVAKLKANIGERDEKIVALEAKLGAAGTGDGGLSAEELEKIKKKLKDAEVKLAEYQIIEDDIANLSLYKDENAKLKDEIEKLKNSLQSGGFKVTDTPNETEEPAAGEDLLAAFEAEVAQGATPEQAAPEATAEADAAPVATAAPVEVAAATTAPAAPTKADVDLMAEFESAVKAQKTEDPESTDPEMGLAMQDNNDGLMAEFENAIKTSETAKKEAPAVAPAPVPAAVAPAAGVAPPVVETAAPSAAPASEIAATPAATVAAPQPAAPQPAAPVQAAVTEPAETLPPALAAELDTDQMLSELENFEPPATTDDPGGDEGDRLIAEFENFVKSTGEKK